MRLIDVCNDPIRTVAVSPDGRFVAAGADTASGIFHWATGEPITRPAPYRHPANSVIQFAFAQDSTWLVHTSSTGIVQMTSLDREYRNWSRGRDKQYAGGIAVS